ncbi:hypothetical protein EHQ23_07350 [Leptospira bourretii]|uniref:Uncharacterized protein n=1 Tax=Leptospira bourretii TaxID=2484962 RepID=A0A4R9IGW7_9LEPT|nr:tetratricopeptide repeat protein [Leptospira bourretii]TGK87204.1 hypothetical protein EHQ23_07350 [Leptospira bourretii]TGK87662.1 hypothetical protein EHQ26_19465 [Leptospira bourretii]TGL43924.1 hypothetical protein EHQ45_00020 [Leptospira bourretii]
MKFIFFILLLAIGCGNSHEINLQKYMLAKGYYLQGDLNNSAKIFKEIYEDDPEFEDVDLHLIKIEFYRGNFPQSLEFIESALESGRWNQQALIFKTRIYLLNSDKKEELIPIVEKMLKLDSSNLDALLLAGKVYELQNKTSDAIIAYNRIISETERIRTAHLQLSKIYNKIGLKANSGIHESAAKKLLDESPQKEVIKIKDNIVNKIKSKRK